MPMNLSSLTVSSALGDVLYHMSEKEALSSLSEFEMFVLISGCHIGPQRWCTNMAAPYKTL